MSEQWITSRIKQKGDCKCIPWRHLKDLILARADMKKRIDVFTLSIYDLVVFPKVLGHVEEAVSDLFDRLDKGVTPVPAILAETFRSLNACRKAGEGRFMGCAQLLLSWFHSHFWKVEKVSYKVFFENYSPLKELAVTPRQDDLSREKWIAILQNLQVEDVKWRAPWMIPDGILYQCGEFDWAPLLGIWGAVGYASLLVMRQYQSRQFIPATHGLTQCELSYKDDNYKKRVREISSAWTQTQKMKRLSIGPMATPEYDRWWGKRINDNIPMPSRGNARPIKEQLQVIPSELKIIKHDFEKRARKLEKKIEQLEEEKMQLGSSSTILKNRIRLKPKSSLREKERKEGNLEAEHPYGTRAKSKKMDQRYEQLQKKIQEQVQAQIQEQLAKIQQDMMDKMMESQRNMMAQMTQMTQLLNGLMERGKGPMAITGEESEGIPSGFTPPHAPVQPEEYLQRPSVTIRPQQGQANIRPPVNLQVGSGSNPRDDPVNLVIPDLDLMEKEETRAESSRQLEDRCRWLKALKNTDHRPGINAKDLSLVPDLVLPNKFKMPEFEKYNGTSCPEAHITMFCRRMTGYVNNDQPLIHCFQDSLIGSTAKWYNQLSRTQIGSWEDMIQAFMKQYGYVTDVAPDRFMLQNMEKKSSKSFRQYAQRWRQVAMQVQPLLLEKERTMLFINTVRAPFITHMVGSTTKSFADIVMAGEMIKNAIMGERIEAGEATKRSVPRKKDNKVNNMSTYNKWYSKTVTINPPKVVTTGQ
ncbi:Gag-pro-like protein [Gossypium australe]|uniref:Gag-pro-like protein n=1 Tax=Gossypium australe TaxID=47621 RepID=A0A5B6WBY2_9ROSI|nr:Gag-pro-like protein [Gossypium australe]